MTGLQDAVQEYLKAPPVSMLPHPSFASSLSVHLEEGMHQMLEVVTEMLNQALSDQGSQDSKKNAWKSLKLGGTVTSRQWDREEDKNGNVLFYYPEFFDLPYNW